MGKLTCRVARPTQEYVDFLTPLLPKMPPRRRQVVDKASSAVTCHSALGRFSIRFAWAPVRGVQVGILSLPSIPVTNLPIDWVAMGDAAPRRFGLDPKLWTRAFGGRFAI